MTDAERLMERVEEASKMEVRESDDPQIVYADPLAILAAIVDELGITDAMLNALPDHTWTATGSTEGEVRVARQRAARHALRTLLEASR